MDKVDKSVNNYFEKVLMDNGYRWFYDQWKNSIRGFQKRFTDEFGIKYFITGYHYNHGLQIPNSTAPYVDSYTFTTQFRLHKDNKDNTINIEFNGDFLHNEYRPITTLQDAEEFFEKQWQTFKFEYYEKYNE